LSDKVKILIADKIDLTHLKILNKKLFDVTLKTGMSNPYILKYTYDKYFNVLLIKSQRKIDKHFLSRCNFEIIGTASKGVDHIDLKYAEKRKILIINSENGNTLSAAEHTFALILDSIKKTHYSDKLVRQGRFNEWGYERRTMSGKRIGIIGTGKVGLQVAKFALAFNMEVLANDIDPLVRKENINLKYRSLKYLLRNSDIVTVHIPLCENNRMFIDKECFKTMPANIIFVNTSRGEVIDERSLIKKLQREKQFFSALDVFMNEPEINSELSGLANVILTNHVAGKTREGEQNIGLELFTQLKNKYCIN